MIISDKGMVKLNGKTTEVLADLALVVDGLHQTLTKDVGEEKSKEMIMEAVGCAFMSDEELDAGVKELEKSLLQKKSEVTEKLFKLLFEGRL